MPIVPGDDSWKAPGTAATSGADTDWTNPDNAKVAEGTPAYATCQVTGVGASRLLQLTNFGFAIPVGALITGVRLRVRRLRQDTAMCVDKTIQLVVGGSGSGANKAALLLSWPTSAANADYGGALDVWDVLPTAAVVNASNFGVQIAVSFSAAGATTAAVDYGFLQVWYLTAADQQDRTGRKQPRRQTRRLLGR